MDYSSLPSNMSSRDMTLVNVLERLANHIEQYELRLDEIDKNQRSLFLAVEDIRFQLGIGQNASGAELSRLGQDFKRYRSDMMTLANEQKRIDNSIKEIAARQASIFTAQEDTARSLAELEKHYETQEKLMRDHSTHSAAQGEAVLKDVRAANERASKLHMETEKSVLSEYRKIQRMLEEIRSETKGRMPVIDEMEAMLKVLINRSEPPPPKEPSRITLLCRRVIAKVLEILPFGKEK